jgi:hypothetical protein
MNFKQDKELQKEFGYPDQQDWTWTVTTDKVEISLNGKYFDEIMIDDLISNWIDKIEQN